MGGKTYCVLAEIGILTAPKIHVHCGCYLMVALAVANRVGMIVPPPDSRYAVENYGRYRKVLQPLLGRTAPTNMDELPLRYSGIKRAKYERALASFDTSPLINRRDAYVKVFVKKERVWYDDKSFGRPRLIMPRSPRYNLAFMAHYLRIEERLLELQGYPFVGRPVAKGRTQEERYLDLLEKFEHTPHFVCFDLKAFEAHYNREAFQFLDATYLNCRSQSADFKRLLSLRHRTVGVSSTGLRYRQDFKRSSGDVDTGGGNTILAMAIVHSYLMARGLPLNSYHDGDDGVVFYPRHMDDFVEGLVAHGLAMGFEIECEEPSSTLTEINFCQTVPYPSLQRMQRNPLKSLRQDAVFLRSLTTATESYEWIKAIGVCYSYVYRGVPIGQAYAQALLGQLPLGVPTRLELIPDLQYKYHIPTVIEDWKMEVTNESRIDFALWTGMSPYEQVLVEDSLSGLRIDLWPGVPVSVTAQPNASNFRQSKLDFQLGPAGVGLAGRE